jgi:hypothetical protein
MLVGMGDLVSVTGEVPGLSEKPVTLGTASGPRTALGGGLTLPALYASASSPWMRNIVCRQSISDSWLGNLRECLAHLV